MSNKLYGGPRKPVVKEFSDPAPPDTPIGEVFNEAGKALNRRPGLLLAEDYATGKFYLRTDGGVIKAADLILQAAKMYPELKVALDVAMRRYEAPPDQIEFWKEIEADVLTLITTRQLSRATRIALAGVA